MLPPACRAQREVVGVRLGCRHVDVHPRRHQCRYQVRAAHGCLCGECRSEGEPGNDRRAAETRTEQLQQKDGVVDHAGATDLELVVAAAPWPCRSAGAALVPVDDGELLLEVQQALEDPDLVDDGQARALLHQQQHGVRRIAAADPDPLRDATEADRFQRVDVHSGRPAPACPPSPAPPGSGWSFAVRVTIALVTCVNSLPPNSWPGVHAPAWTPAATRRATSAASAAPAATASRTRACATRRRPDESTTSA